MMSDPAQGARTPPTEVNGQVSVDADAFVRAVANVSKPRRDWAAIVAAVASIGAVIFTGLTYWYGPESLSRDRTNKEIVSCTRAVAVTGALSLPVDTTWERRKARFWDYYTGDRFLLSKVDIEPMLIRVHTLLEVEHITPRVFAAGPDPALSLEKRKERAYAALNDSAEAYARQIADRCNSLYPVATGIVNATAKA